MKLSPYFHDLSQTYAYEIEDLTYDSGGDDVLRSRLKVKRDQFVPLLPMCTSDPAMVAPAFHGAFKFTDNALMDQLVSVKPGQFPSWEAVAPSIEMPPWATLLVERALQADGGEEFMLIAAGLEYIIARMGTAGAAGDAEQLEDENEGDDGEDIEDLGDAGEDYLGDQGFDRRS